MLIEPARIISFEVQKEKDRIERGAYKTRSPMKYSTSSQEKKKKREKHMLNRVNIMKQKARKQFRQ